MSRQLGGGGPRRRNGKREVVITPCTSQSAQPEPYGAAHCPAGGQGQVWGLDSPDHDVSSRLLAAERPDESHLYLHILKEREHRVLHPALYEQTTRSSTLPQFTAARLPRYTLSLSCFCTLTHTHTHNLLRARTSIHHETLRTSAHTHKTAPPPPPRLPSRPRSKAGKHLLSAAASEH